MAKKEDLFSQAMENHGKMVFGFFPDSPAAFTMARTVYRLDISNPNSYIGFFMCDISTSAFFDIFGYHRDQDAISYILTDTENQIIANSSPFTDEEFLQISSFAPIISLPFVISITFCTVISFLAYAIFNPNTSSTYSYKEFLHTSYVRLSTNLLQRDIR